MSGKPNGAEQENHAEKKFRANGDSTLESRLERRNIIGGFDENEHRAERHGYDEHGGQHGRENHFHETGAA